MKAERLRKNVMAIIMASDFPPPPSVGKEIDDDIAALEAKAAELDRKEQGVVVESLNDAYSCGNCSEKPLLPFSKYCINCGTKLIWESEAVDDI